MAQVNKVFADAFALCCVSYDQQFNSEKARIYFEMLKSYSAEQIHQAFKLHILDPDRGRFFPKIADIVYQIEGNDKQRSETLEQQAELQWSAIVKASCNGVEPLNISLEARSALRSIGGSHKVGYTLEKDLPFLKKDFVALFKSIAAASSDQIDDYIPLSLELKNKKSQVAIK